MRAHKINPTTGEILNTFEVPSLAYEPDLIDGSIGGGRGWTYKLGALSAPASQGAQVKTSAVPNEITRFQAKAALLQNNLLDTLEALIAASGNRLYQMAWQDSTTFHRDSPLLKSFAAAANITDTQLDDMFIQASKIKV